MHPPREPTTATIVLAHRADQQLGRLLHRLLLSDTGIIVHLDSRAPTAVPLGGPAESKRVRYTQKRYATAWGSFEAVTAALSLLEEALASFPAARYVSLISGQDYPIKPPSYLDAFFASSDHDYILAMPLRDEKWRYGGLRRIDRYHWARDRKSIAGFLWRTLPLPPRRFPLPIERLFRGSQWWSLRRGSVERILAFVRANPTVLEAFRWTYVPDEVFFATVLVGYLGESNVAFDNKRHVEWFSLPRDYLRLKILGRNGIRVLGIADLPTLAASSALFARKFDARTDSEVLAALDEIAGIPFIGQP